MKNVFLLTTGIALFSTALLAQDAEVDLEKIAAFAAGACIYDETGDMQTPFKTTLKAAQALGLPVVVEDEKSGIYGDMSALFIIVNVGLDNLGCIIQIPATDIDHDGFEVLETLISQAFTDRHPGHMTGADDDPSPHVDGRDWVLDTDAKDHIAATLSFGTEDGVQFTSVAQKTYE